MTATLPSGMRDGYAKAFQKGLRIRRPREVAEDAYPLLTVVGHGIDSERPDPVPSTCRDVRVHRLEDEGSAMALLQSGVGQGAACVWIRNTVDAAIAAVSALRAAGFDADLLHARFAVVDRLRHEVALQARFGRDGDGRARRVLVATQVVEASLDLDFDLMISDLAPIGSLIQRAGRLWRHMDLRPASGRAVAGPALHVLAPDPDVVRDSNWLRSILGSGAFVYPQDTQWRTAKALFEEGAIRAPGGLRALIEAVHGSDLPAVPDALSGTEIETLGRQMSEAQQAYNQVLDAEDGYDQPQMQRVFDDDRFPTRLGVPQVTLRLARERRAVDSLGRGGPARLAVVRGAGLGRALPEPSGRRPRSARDRGCARQVAGMDPGIRSRGTGRGRRGGLRGMRYDSALGIVFTG